jgi:SAM-dependent methyltransferase
MTESPSPDRIMEVGAGFFASKTLLSAVELELFTVLGAGQMTGAGIGDRLSLHPRSLFDFLDALVSMGFLERDGDGPDALYMNTAETGTFLDKNSRAYVGGMLEMANSRLYGFWGNLTEALRTGEPQNEIRDGGDLFAELYSDEHRLEQFLRAMQGFQTGAFMALLDVLDFSSVSTVVDVGGANGQFCALAVSRHPHLKATVFDLPPVKPIAERHVAAMGASDRIEVVAGDFFVDDLPSGDLIVMGNVLHDWDEDQKRMLIAKAYSALSDGGRLVAIENVIDDARRENTFGLLMSLNMLIELPGGFDYTGAQFDTWCRDAGFEHTEVVHLVGPTSAAIAHR